MVFKRCYDLLGDSNRFRVAVGLFSDITEYVKMW